MKTTFAINVVLAGMVCAAQAALTDTWTFSPGVTIPNGNPTGWSSMQTVDWDNQHGDPGTWTMTDVNVTLNVSGGYNGDLYAYLVHDGTLVVLLNRVGKTTGSAFGYSDSGFNIKLNDQASETTDIHLYRTVGSWSVTDGTEWRPDGRKIDPAIVLDSDIRQNDGNPLAMFNGANPNGAWTIFFADMAGGNQSTLNSWSLEITAVPEPATVALGVFAVLFGGIQFVRWRRSRSPA